MKIDNKFNRGNLIWQVEHKLRPTQYVITGPYKIEALNIIANKEGIEIFYTTNVGTSNGMLKLTEKMKVFTSLEGAVKHVKSALKLDQEKKEAKEKAKEEEEVEGELN